MKKDLNKLNFEELKKEVETLDKQKESAGKINVKDSPLVLNENYLIRTVTMIYTGKLVKAYDKELVLVECAWIPETERWADTVEKGIFKEVEPYPKDSEVIINREAILDITKVYWKLPDKQK
jgi:hypothetical protein